MLTEHNGHQLNVNVINVGRRAGSFYKQGKTMTPGTNKPLSSGVHRVSQTVNSITS